MRIVALHGFLGVPQDFAGLKSCLEAETESLEFYAPALFDPVATENLVESFASWPEKFRNDLKRNCPFSLEKSVMSPRILVGYSLGGRLALDFEAHADSPFDFVFVLGAQPGFLSESERSVRLKNDHEWAARLANDPWEEFQTKWNAQSLFHQGGASIEPLRFAGDYSQAKLRSSLENLSLARMRLTPEQLRLRAAKTHWCVGEKDLKVRALYEELLASGVVGSLHVISESGHRLIFDNPQAIGGLILQVAERFKV